MLIANYTLSSMVSRASFNEYDYNTIVTVDTAKEESTIRDFVADHLAIKSYYVIRGHLAYFDDAMVNRAELHVYDFEDYNGKMKERISDELSVDRPYMYILGLTPGSDVDLYINNPLERVTLSLSNQPEYRSPFPDTRYAIAVSSEGIGVLPDEIYISFFLNASNHERGLLNDLVAGNQGMLITTAEDNIETEISAISDYKYIFDLMTLFFIICIFTVVLSGNVITYISRMKEFCIYYGLGATLGDIKKITAIENVILLIMGIAYGVVISYAFLATIAQTLKVALGMDYVILLSLAMAFSFMAAMAVFIAFKVLPYKSLNNILGDSGRT
jgi:ABC-type antimicrobial peptide transport system permease subunit